MKNGSSEDREGVIPPAQGKPGPSALGDTRQVRAGLDPQRFTVKTAPALLAKSKLWQDYGEGETSLKAAIQKFVGRR